MKWLQVFDCDMADHEDDDGMIRPHWHCEWMFEHCFQMHKTEDDAKNCKGEKS